MSNLPVVSGLWKEFQHEDTVISVENFLTLISNLTENSQFVWRGSPDESWALHSSLYRRLWWKEIEAAKKEGRSPVPPCENDLYVQECSLIEAAQKWGLHNGARGRLSTLSLLATMQHFGSPTRLIDVTFNPLVALWFAVENDKYDAKEGRIFCIDVTNKIINDKKRIASSPLVPNDSWEDKLEIPWLPYYYYDSKRNRAGEVRGWSLTKAAFEWTSNAWVWVPPPFEARIAAQQGAFLFGGVPTQHETNHHKEGFDGNALRSYHVPDTKKPNHQRVDTDELRAIISVAMRPTNTATAKPRGRPPANPLLSFVIAHEEKKKIREELLHRYGYSAKIMYPDFPGFSDHGSLFLPSRPP